MRLGFAEERNIDSKPGLPEYTAAFSISSATLALQLVQTRIYGVVFWNHLVYFIISIALLGFGISGAWLAVAGSSAILRWLTVARAGIFFGFSAIVTCLFVPRIAVSIGSIVDHAWQDVGLFTAYGAAVLPYFFGGWMLGRLFQAHAQDIGTLYFADLVGAGIGCLVYVALIQGLGAPRLVVLIAIFAALPSLFADGSRGTRILAIGLALFAAACWFNAAAINRGISPEPTKAFHRLYAEIAETDAPVTELSEWNTISRIDLRSRVEAPEEKRIYIDGDAWTQIVPGDWDVRGAFDPAKEPLTNHKAPFFFQPHMDSALVIGFGGGVDVWMALRSGATYVDAIEINPTTFRALLGEYSDFSGGLLSRAGVHAFNEEGRSFVRRSPRNYDVIILHGIDTFAALNAGAYVLSENYLYTVDAIEDYLRHLEPEGMLSITRWVHYAETPRLFTVVLEALTRLGVAEPERHVIFHGHHGGTIVVRKTPFTDAEISSFNGHLERWGGTSIYPAMDGTDQTPEQKVIAEYLDARTSGRTGAYLGTLTFNIAPVYDDSPFFFHFDRARYMWKVFRERGAGNFVRGHWPSFTLLTLLGLAALATLVFVIAPLLKLGWRGFPRFPIWSIYFSCLGVGFIFAEIALMQRFALLLGHPARSLACVLATLLVAAGIGSRLSSWNRVSATGGLLAAVCALAAVAWGYPAVIERALSLPLAVRATVTVLLVSPIGLLLGMPFPRGIRELADVPNAVPWMWGVNGGATVVGSVLAIVLAIWTNFTTVLLSAAAIYLAALGAWRIAARKA